MDPSRVRVLCERPVQPGRYVLYWMQSAQRVAHNDALGLAIEKANELSCPLLVCFGLVGRYLGASARQYAFMAAGLAEVARRLAERRIAFVLRLQSPESLVLDLAREARCVVLDRGYLRIHRRWYRYLAQRLPCAAWQFETNVVVPVAVASDHEQYAARTLRPRIERALDRYLRPTESPELRANGEIRDIPTLHAADPLELLATMGVGEYTPSPLVPRGGEAEARRRLEAFIEDGLERYAGESSDPALQGQSGLSAYLHFGQISPVEVALRVRAAGHAASAAFLEQLIVRRELAINMVHYNVAYDSLRLLPDWARATLLDHAGDPRPYLYSLSELEAGRTHDVYWNAAQREIVITGTMHGYMRMYWGKKIIEWSPSAASALARMLYLNDAYELDGRDPNGYAGAAWCLGKHDQGWAERPIFGKVRYMNARGLERKFDIQAYVSRIAGLEEQATRLA